MQPSLPIKRATIPVTRLSQNVGHGDQEGLGGLRAKGAGGRGALGASGPGGEGCDQTVNISVNVRIM